MSDDRTFERNARAWLELGPADAPDRVVEAALLEVESTSQERDLRIPWRFPTMTTPFRLAAAAVIGVLAIGAGLMLFNQGQQSQFGSPSMAPTPTTSASSTPQASPITDYSTLPGWIVFEHFGKAPDGSTPAGVDYPHGLWLVHADGSGLHELAPGLPAVGKLSFDISPDGTRVAFGTYDLPAQIWEVGIEDGDPQLLSKDCNGQPGECEDGAPAYSPDGRRIAFIRGTDQGYFVAIRDLASDTVTMLEPTRSTSPDGWLAEPSWSPDGEQIVYHEVIYDAAQDKVLDTNIFIVNADGTGLHELALPDGMPWGDADWSPDGSRIVFSSYPIREFNSENASVYTVRPDGTDVQQLTSTGIGNGAPTWNSDGAHIFYWGFRAFYLMDPDGGNAKSINPGELDFYGDVLGYGYYGALQPTP
jgi:dipeptidyl aminopeptidase/acylaminoacyl peptidase